MRSFPGYTARTIKGTIIDGRYVLGDLLGSGGMARVFLAHDQGLDRDVALKILWEQYANNEEFVERFRREARSAAALNHPKIVSVYDWGCSEDEMYYIVMEYIPGGTLKDRIIGEGALDPATAAQLGSQVAEALGFAHKHGVIHRDVKPQNILLGASGEVKVADFGIARAVGAMAATAVSQASVVLGTVGYMSPEQVMGEPLGPASDLYSVGVVLYEMLTGNLPHEAESPIALAMKHVSEAVRPPKEVNPEVPDGMNALVSRLLAKKGEHRYGSALELAQDLWRVRDGLLPLGVRAVVAEPGAATRINAQPTVPTPQAAALNKRGKWTKAPRILTAAFVLFALLGGSGWSLLHSSFQEQDLVFNQGDSQGFTPALDPENEAPQASEEAEQAPSVEVASVKEPSQVAAPSSVASGGTTLGPVPISSAALDPSTLTAAPVNHTLSLEPQPALESAPTQQEAEVQVESEQQAQAQVQVISSQTANGESEAQKSSGTQRGQPIDQVVQNSKPSHK